MQNFYKYTAARLINIIQATVILDFSLVFVLRISPGWEKSGIARFLIIMHTFLGFLLV
jgi:hypothetical protein